MADARVTHAERAGLHVLRYFGRVDYTLAPAIERFVEPFFGGPPLEGFVFDLREAQFLDSTNLGLLARICERARQACGARSMILSGNDDIDDVLHSMGFEEIFDIVRDDGAAVGTDAEKEIERGEKPSQADLRKTMLAAHRALCALNERDREQFQDVVTWLESEAGSR